MEPITLTAVAAAAGTAATTAATTGATTAAGITTGQLVSGGLTGFILFNMGNNFRRNLQAAAETALFKALTQGERKALEDLFDTFGELAAQEKQNRTVVSPQFMEDLGELTSLLCLDACHHRVAKQVARSLSHITHKQMMALRGERHRIKGASDTAREMRLALLWDPEYAEFFEATKEDTEQVELLISTVETRLTYIDLPHDSPEVQAFQDNMVWMDYYIPPFTNADRVDLDFMYTKSYGVDREYVSIWCPESYAGSEATPMDVKQAFRQCHEDVRQSIEALFDRAKELHETQRQLADALRAHDTLLKSYNLADHLKSGRKWGEVTALLAKLGALSQPDKSDSSANEYNPESGTIADIVVDAVPYRDISKGVRGKQLSGITSTRQFESRWKRAKFRLILLRARFDDPPAVENRQEQIAARFKAVGATDEQRDAIVSSINALYGAIHRRWEEDPWIQKMRDDVCHSVGYDYSPFADRQFAGWRKEKSKRRQLFLAHYDMFQFKSPRQYAEDALLQLIEKMEFQSDTYFVRDERRTKELNDILEEAQDQMNAGNFDAALTHYQNADRHAPNNAGVRCAIAFVHKRTGNFDAAIAECQNANRLAPEDARPLFHLAYIYAMQGENLQEAVTLIQRALSLYEETDTLNIVCARQILGWLYLQQGEAETALGELADPVHEQFVSPLFYLVLGDAYKATEQHESAEHAWQSGWHLANTPEWTDRAGATPFEADQHAAQRADLGERLGTPEENTE